MLIETFFIKFNDTLIWKNRMENSNGCQQINWNNQLGNVSFSCRYPLSKNVKFLEIPISNIAKMLCNPFEGNNKLKLLLTDEPFPVDEVFKLRTIEFLIKEGPSVFKDTCFFELLDNRNLTRSPRSVSNSPRWFTAAHSEDEQNVPTCSSLTAKKKNIAKNRKDDTLEVPLLEHFEFSKASAPVALNAMNIQQQLMSLQENIKDISKELAEHATKDPGNRRGYQGVKRILKNNAKVEENVKNLLDTLTEED